MFKVCTKCGEEKEENRENFQWENFQWENSRNKFKSQCKSCYKSKSKTKPKSKRKNKTYNLNEKLFRICSKCGVHKELTNDNFHKNYNNFIAKCKICSKKQSKKYYEQNKTVIIEKNKKYQDENKERIKAYHIEYMAKNTKRLKEYKSNYYSSNIDIINKKNCEYNKNNREKINAKRRERIEKDLRFRISDYIRKSIQSCVKRRGLIKESKTFEALNFSPEDFIKHIESQFEWWMNWDNHGKYNPNSWDNNNPLTWTWQVDHIVPDSCFNYNSITDIEFKQSWSLNNLRPYNAKQNILDGTRRTRHVK